MRQENRFPRQDPTPGTHQFTKKALRGIAAVPEFGLKINIVVQIHHGTGFGNDRFGRIQLDFHQLTVVAFDFVIDLVAFHGIALLRQQASGRYSAGGIIRVAATRITTSSTVAGFPVLLLLLLLRHSVLLILRLHCGLLPIRELLLLPSIVVIVPLLLTTVRDGFSLQDRCSHRNRSYAGSQDWSQATARRQ